MGFMNLHDQYGQNIENWQSKLVDFEVELEELHTQLQNIKIYLGTFTI